MTRFNRKNIFFLVLFITSCGVFTKVSNKSSNRLLDEFRVDEYRNFVIISKDEKSSRFTNVSMYSEEKRRYVNVKVPNWLSSYWEVGDTIK